MATRAIHTVALTAADIVGVRSTYGASAVRAQSTHVINIAVKTRLHRAPAALHLHRAGFRVSTLPFGLLSWVSDRVVSISLVCGEFTMYTEGWCARAS